MMHYNDLIKQKIATMPYGRAFVVYVIVVIFEEC